MANYISQLHLGYDPFVATAKHRTFFGGAGRDALLQRLIEQAHYGAPISAVCGPLGSGKSSLANEFRKGFSDEALCIPVQATLFMNQGQFLDAVLEQLPIGAPTPDPDEIVKALGQFAERLYLDAKSLILVIDDAHELASDVLQTIDRLTQITSESAVHVLLLGENQLGNMLHNALGEELAGRLIEEQLHTFATDDAAGYVQQKLSDAGYHGSLPLSVAALGEIVNEANGIPGAINALVADALAQLTDKNLEAQTAAPSNSTLIALSAPYLATAAVLMVALLAALFVFAPESELEVAQDESPDGAGSGTTRIELPVTPNVVAANVRQQATELPVSGLEPDEVIPGAAVDAAGIVGTVGGESAEAASAEELDISEVAATPLVVPKEVVEHSSNEPEDKYSGASVFERQLLAAPASHYTVQIMGSRSETNVQEFSSQKLGAFNPGYFETRYQEEPWFVVVVGTYASRDEASAALVGLPAAIREMEPWIRNLGDIQASIRLLHGTN